MDDQLYSQDKVNDLIRAICELARERECNMLEVMQACRSVQVTASAMIGARKADGE